MNIYAIKKPNRINSVTVTLAVGGLLIGYLLYWWLPIFWPIFRMTGIMKSACSEAYRNPNDEAVMEKLIADASRTGLRIDERNFRYRRIPFTRAERQASQITEESFVNRRGKECEIAFHYEDDYPLPLIGKTTRLVFERTITQTLEHTQYDKLCTCVSVPGGPALGRVPIR